MRFAAVAPEKDLEKFFARLPVPQGHFVEIRSIIPDQRGATQRFCTGIYEAIEAVHEAAGVANVYLGACPRSKPRGTRDAITVATAAWADLDFHTIDTKCRDRAEGIARHRLADFTWQPTILVHTGNGLQAWWIYAEPILVSGAWPVERFEAINRGIARALGGDSVHDIARVLRVPGTLNLPDEKKRGRGCVPVMARLLFADGPTHHPEVFDDIATDTRPAMSRPPAPKALARSAPPRAEILAAFLELIAQLGPGHPLSRTWRGDRFLADRSRSGWDMALVNHLYKTRVQEEFIPSILRAFPHGRGVFATNDYIRRTMAKTRAMWRERGTTRSA